MEKFSFSVFLFAWDYIGWYWMLKIQLQSENSFDRYKFIAVEIYFSSKCSLTFFNVWLNRWFFFVSTESLCDSTKHLNENRSILLTMAKRTINKQFHLMRFFHFNFTAKDWKFWKIDSYFELFSSYSHNILYVAWFTIKNKTTNGEKWKYVTSIVEIAITLSEIKRKYFAFVKSCLQSKYKLYVYRSVREIVNTFFFFIIASTFSSLKKKNI